MYDGRGSVSQLTNSKGTTVASYKYDIYGETKTTNHIINNPYKYNAEATDGATGMQYLRARYYNPNNHRFMSKDTYQGSLESSLSRNNYAYANNNPVNFQDPSGHFALTWATALTIGVVVYTVVKIGVDIYQTCKNHKSYEGKIVENRKKQQEIEKKSEIQYDTWGTKEIKDGKQKDGKYIAKNGSKIVKLTSKKEFKEYKKLCQDYDKLNAEQTNQLAHDMLDVCADLPVIGGFFATENAMIYAYENDYINVGKSIFSAVNKFKTCAKTKDGKELIENGKKIWENIKK